MFPRRSSFISPAPRSAWWTERRQEAGAPVEEIAETDGLSFMAMLIERLREMSRYQQTYDGSPIGPRVFDGRWNNSVARTVWSYGDFFGAPRALLDGVASEARAGRAGPASIRLAVWIVRGRYVFLTRSRMGIGFENLTVPEDVIPPMWGVAPPVPYSLSTPPLSIRRTGGATLVAMNARQ